MHRACTAQDLTPFGRERTFGPLLTLGVTRLVAAFLYGVKATDPATIVLSGAVLATVALAAAMLPAWRAARLHPVSALRDD